MVADDVDETHMVVAADFTGDGHIDLTASDFVDGIMFWYENDGEGNFTTHTLDDDLEGAYPVNKGDVNQDGHMDILAAGYLSDTYVWYENDGAGNFTKHVIDDEADGDLRRALEKDGDLARHVDDLGGARDGRR